jgi:hypothetical protein
MPGDRDLAVRHLRDLRDRSVHLHTVNTENEPREYGSPSVSSSHTELPPTVRHLLDVTVHQCGYPVSAVSEIKTTQTTLAHHCNNTQEVRSLVRRKRG